MYYRDGKYIGNIKNGKPNGDGYLFKLKYDCLECLCGSFANGRIDDKIMRINNMDPTSNQFQVENKLYDYNSDFNLIC